MLCAKKRIRLPDHYVPNAILMREYIWLTNVNMAVHILASTVSKGDSFTTEVVLAQCNCNLYYFSGSWQRPQARRAFGWQMWWNNCPSGTAFQSSHQINKYLWMLTSGCVQLTVFIATQLLIIPSFPSCVKQYAVSNIEFVMARYITQHTRKITNDPSYLYLDKVLSGIL